MWMRGNLWLSLATHPIDIRITKIFLFFLGFTTGRVVRKLELCQLSQQIFIDFLLYIKHDLSLIV